LNRPKSCSFEREKKTKKKAIEGDETLTNSIKQSTQQRGQKEGPKKTKEKEREREREKTQVQARMSKTHRERVQC
jgi:hypothetical protein